jgi:hypothetical protein
MDHATGARQRHHAELVRPVDIDREHPVAVGRIEDVPERRAPRDLCRAARRARVDLGGERFVGTRDRYHELIGPGAAITRGR